MPVMKFDVNETYAPNPRTTAKGQYIVHISIDKDGNEKPPLPLADKFDIVGNGTDGSGAHYRIIRYQDRCTRQTRHAALPCAEIGSNAAWAKLQGMGIVVYSGRAKREYLADYLQTAGSRDFWQITDKAGWQGNAYILPSGEVLQADEGECRVLYNGDTSQAAAYTAKGSLQEWRENVAKYAAGNSRLLLAIGAALAAPMMNRLEEAGSGFHLYGASRDGKTTAAKAALSVWGDPDAAKLSWNGTALGFGNTALARNDNLLVLDEIGQVKHAKTVSETAYAVIDGTGKIQGHKDGGTALSANGEPCFSARANTICRAMWNAAARNGKQGKTCGFPACLHAPYTAFTKTCTTLRTARRYPTTYCTKSGNITARRAGHGLRNCGILTPPPYGKCAIRSCKCCLN